MSVNHQNFSVVAIIVVGGDKGRYMRKHLTTDSQCLQFLRIIARQQRKFTGAVIHHADIHALCGFFCQDFQHPAPHFPFVHNKIFHKNEMLCRFKLPQHLFKFIFSKRKICHRRLVIHRMAAAPAHIMHQGSRSCIFLRKRLHHLLLLHNLFLCMLNNPVNAHL